MDHRIEQISTIFLPSIQVSPRSFKRQIETVLEALAQLNMSVTLFAKLPRGKSWWLDLQHYRQAINPAPEIFLWVRDATDIPAWQQPILIPDAAPMQGEYFVLGISDTVAFWLHGDREATPTNINDEASESTVAGVEDETLPIVNYRLTFQTGLIQDFVTDLKQSLHSSVQQQPEQPIVTALLAQWGDRTRLPQQCHPALFDAVAQQAGSHQERLQRQARSYRRQAMTASSLSTQNESLMNTLRLKDDFLNTVGQELRTPLSSIKTALPLLSSPNLKPPQRQRYLDMISRECDRQVNLINGVLELLQIERTVMTAQPEPVNLFDVLPGVVSTYQPLAQEKGIRLAYTVPNNLPPICCPENWVRQIVIQLLSNSIRFTEPGGEVWVTAQPDEEEFLTISIKDTGVGIPQNELPHVFEHFYQGRQASGIEEGVGLGLAIVRQLLVYCDGQISVESQPDVGTHFIVKLPLHS
ncbi:sensor histidine kinase [Leptolyngbya iicbica]|uniref:histidine kinase n=3 Tax=Cyanophyceae TaxID=3028117 RepID=A0A4Q7E4T3_9CYAN|nr:sensor histidine kinase [Leptolyngbya sp. LK]